MSISGFADFATTYLLDYLTSSNSGGNQTGATSNASPVQSTPGLSTRSALDSPRPRQELNLPTLPSQVYFRPPTLHDLPSVHTTGAGQDARPLPQDPIHAGLIQTVEKTLNHFRGRFHRGTELGLLDGARDYDCIQAVLAAFDDPGRRLVYMNSPRELAVWLDTLDAQNVEGRYSVVFRCDTEETDHSVAIHVGHTAGGTTRLDVIESLDSGSDAYAQTRRELDLTIAGRPQTQLHHHSVPVQARMIGCPFHAAYFALNAPIYLQSPQNESPFRDAPDLALHAESVGRLIAVERTNIASRNDKINGSPPPVTLQEYFDAHACREMDKRAQPMSDSIERFRLDMLEKTAKWLRDTPTERVLERMERVRPANEGHFRALGLFPESLETGLEVSTFRKLPRHGLGKAVRFWRREDDSPQHPQVPRPEPALRKSDREAA